LTIVFRPPISDLLDKYWYTPRKNNTWSHSFWFRSMLNVVKAGVFSLYL